jgi:hypothetical protein
MGWTFSSFAFSADMINYIGHACLDHRHTGNNRFHSGNAHPVNGDSGRRCRDAGQQGCDAGYVERIDRLHAAPIADIIDDRRINTGSIDSSFHRYTGDGGCVTVTQGPAEGSNSGSAG